MPFAALTRAALLCCTPALLLAQPPAQHRPPAVPLIAHNPYFSVWSFSDRLNESSTVHWTGKPNRLTGLVRVDGRTYQIMGRERRAAPTLEQKSLEVLPTRTLYQFAGAGIQLGLTFFTPALPDDLDVLSRPLTYLEWTASSTDGQAHQVQIYFDASSDLVVNTTDEPVGWGRYNLDGQTAVRMGSHDQATLKRRGDDVRIDWGYLYLAGDAAPGVSLAIAARNPARMKFESSGAVPAADDLPDSTAPNNGANEVLAASIDLGSVAATPVSRYLMIAYDDLYSIEYFQRSERPWWRRNGAGASDLLRDARRDHDSLLTRGKAFDETLMSDLRSAGGDAYARLGALAYRQTLAAHQLAADADGTPMYFPKENFSNGCISTVDVIYPSAPFTLFFNPALLKAQLEPVMQYARMARWPWPFAPHDLGTYPQANGQVYGGGERTEDNQMPVEESGNMIILVDALAKAEGNAAYAEKYWPQLTKWAEYLKAKGLDPENQLSTDDFAGHLAHNANLSIKAILALGAYGQLAETLGKSGEAATYRDLSREYAKKWVELAAEGDHYRLAFDKPNTWSEKYNLVWDHILGLNIFPAEIARKEIAFYDSKLNKYGLPLDNRRDYTKLDWEIWTATLATDRAGFEKILAPIATWMDETQSRVPLTDWYDTVTNKQQGFQARSVVGGVFIKLLSDPKVWAQYRERAAAKH
jgi:hypothetical protein